jgi:hypothetical protein
VHDRPDGLERILGLSREEPEHRGRPDAAPEKQAALQARDGTGEVAGEKAALRVDVERAPRLRAFWSSFGPA